MFGGIFLYLFPSRYSEAISQLGFTSAFAGILLSARAGFFILRELAEFGYMKRLRATFHLSRLVSPFWFPIRSGRSRVGEGDVGMEILLRYRKGEYSHSISPSRDDSTSPGRNR